jgi:hypothetical protein
MQGFPPYNEKHPQCTIIKDCNSRIGHRSRVDYLNHEWLQLTELLNLALFPEMVK